MKKFLNFGKLKLWILILIEIFKRNKAGLGLVFLVICLLLFAQIKFKLFFYPNSISIGLIGTYQEHDLPIEVLRLLSQGLVEVGDKGRIQAKLVSGWETNNDATSFKFKLKDGLSWIDGSVMPSPILRSVTLMIKLPNLI